MLTYVAPLITYCMSYIVMVWSLSRVEVGILFFSAVVPIIAVVQKIAEFPGGNNMADYLLIAMVVGWFLESSKSNKKMFISTPINVVLVLVIVWSGVNLLRGYTYMALPDYVNLTRLMAWKNYMILPLLYFIGVNNIDNEKQVKWLVIIVCFVMLAMDFNFYSTFKWIKATHYVDSIRISGTFSFLGPNELGVFYSMYTFLLFSIGYVISDKRIKYFIFAICGCNFYPILFSYSRAAYMCTLTGILVLGLLKDKKLLLVLVIVIFGYSFILPRSVVERIDMTFLDKEEISESKEQTSVMGFGSVELDTVGRKELWEKAKWYFESHPIIGIGFDTFRHKEGMITHSMYMKILAEQGLIGMGVFLIFTISILKQGYRLFRNSKSEIGKGIGLGFFCCVIVHLVGSISGDQSLYYNLMAIYWLFLGIVTRFNINQAKESRNSEVIV